MTDIIVIEPEIHVVETLRQGPVGPQGPPGEAGGDTETVTFTKTAGEPIGGHRAVRTDETGAVFHASIYTEADAFRVIGVTTHAAATGDPVQIVASGEIEEITWNWTLDGRPVFMGGNGVIVQTFLPDGTFNLIVGFPMTQTRLRVRVGVPVFG